MPLLQASIVGIFAETNNSKHIKNEFTCVLNNMITMTII